MTEHERQPRRGRGSRLAGLLLVGLVALLPACSSKADASTMLDGLGAAGATGTDQVASAKIGDDTYVLNITRSTLSKLGPSKDETLTVPVGEGGVPQLLANDRHLAVLDRGSGRVEWFELRNLLRRSVSLGDGRWHAAIDQRGVVFALEQLAGELVRAEDDGGRKRADAAPPDSSATVSMIDEGVLVRDVARRRDVVFHPDTLDRLRDSEITETGEGRLLPATGPDGANWVLNATTGELVGLGLERGWRGKVAVGTGSETFDPPLALGDWVYVHRSDAGRVVVVHGAEGRLAGVVDTGVTGTQLLADGDHATIVQVERGYAATLRGTDLRVLSSKDVDGVALPKPVVETTRVAEAVKTEPPTVAPTAAPPTASAPPGSESASPAPPTGTGPGAGGGGSGSGGGTQPPPGGGGTPPPAKPDTPLPPATCGPPAAPSTPALQAVDPTTATARWTIASADCLGGFRVQWGAAGQYLGGIDLLPAAREHTISGLPSGVGVEVDVFSRGADGKVVDGTRQRATVTMPTPPPPTVRCPPVAPSVPVLTPLDPTTLSVQWTISSTECLSGFRVQWGAAGQYLGGIVVGPEVTQHTVAGLQPGALAEVDVFSVGADGLVVDASRQRASVTMPNVPGPVCPPIAPSAPVIVIDGPTTITVQWSIASGECLGGFRLQWGSDTRGYIGGIDLGPEATQHTIEGLDPGVQNGVDLFSRDLSGLVVDATVQHADAVLPPV
jgi:hypothetical protein